VIESGEIKTMYVFVGVLSCSQYATVTHVLVPDNLETGLETASGQTPVIKKVYHKMAEHYYTAVIPARIHKPHKPNVEGSEVVASTWILAALRNQQCSGLSD